MDYLYCEAVTILFVSIQLSLKEKRVVNICGECIIKGSVIGKSGGNKRAHSEIGDVYINLSNQM